jgi:hypothetical protein
VAFPCLPLVSKMHLKTYHTKCRKWKEMNWVIKRIISEENDGSVSIALY